MTDDRNLSIDELIDEVYSWSVRNFGEQPVVNPILGMIEEEGELAHAVLKSQQGIRGSADHHRAAALDAVADCFIYLANFAGTTQTAKELDDWDWMRTAHGLTFGSLGFPYSVINDVFALHDGLSGLLGAFQSGSPYGPWMRKVATVLYGIATYYGESLPEVVSHTWYRVRERDWQADPTTAHLEPRNDQ
jgi:NTP pyrophosphatase (non-canonical NTP hydrolase)